MDSINPPLISFSHFFFRLQFCLFNLYVCLKTIYLAETENFLLKIL